VRGGEWGKGDRDRIGEDIGEGEGRDAE